ncbi:hypothetical protein BH10ACT6_BH10ACT6_09180 [soil metagenome]
MTHPGMSTPPSTSADTARDAASAEVEAAVTELFRTGRTWSKRLAEQFRPELSPLSYAILRYVDMHGPLRSSDIVTTFGMDKGAVSRQITILRELGLLDAVNDPDDRRSTVLASSATAKAAFARFTEGIREQYATVLDDWTVGDLSELALLLARLTSALDGRFQAAR